jgi:hypothetical protein
LRFAFESLEIRKICEDHDTATNKFGSAVATMLQIRLSDLRAATNISDIQSGNPGLVPHKPYSQYKVDLAGDLQLIFDASHVKKPPLNEDGDIAWLVVDYIQIIEIRKNNE